MYACLLNAGVGERQLVHVNGQQPRDEVFAGGVDDVQQHDQHRDQPQVPVAEHQAEAAAADSVGSRRAAARSSHGVLIHR